MRHMQNCLVSAVAILAFGASVAGAQTAPTPPSTLTAVEAQDAPPSMTANPRQATLMDGPVKQVDPVAKTVSVGWLFGLFSTTLEVTEDTRIVVEGATGSFLDIQEGDLVKTAYEAHDGKNIAKSIEVTESERPGADAPMRSPATPGSPSMGAPPGSGAPPTGGPKTP